MEDAPQRGKPGQQSTGPRIALAPGSIDGGGIGTAMLNLAEGLVTCGANADLLLTSPPRDGRMIPEGVRVIRLGDRTRRALGASCQYLKSERPEMVISARNYMHLLMAGARHGAGQPGCRLVWTFHTHRSTELAHARRKDRIVDALAMRMLKQADHLIAVSGGVARDLATGSGTPRERIRIIGNAAWSAHHAARARLPCDHPWLRDKDTPVVLGIGRLVPQKDFSTLLRSFARLPGAARLIILGEGPERPLLEGLAAELGVKDRVSMPGQVDNVPAYLARADLFVLSSRWEGFGMVLVEALGCGCPVVATDCPSGPADILQNGTLGRLVPVGDVKAMAESMEMALGSPRPVSPAEEIMRPYSFERVAQSYLALLAPAAR